MRLSNAPTVITNVLVGCAAGAAMPGGGSSPFVRTVTVISAAMLLMYTGGMAMNDAVDAGTDAVERPLRPIPSGRISRAAAWAFAAGSLAAGAALCAIMALPALLLGLTLAGSIAFYNAIHRRTAASILVMALCRGLVYLTACAAVMWPVPWYRLGPPAIGMAAYIALLSCIARRETTGSLGIRRWLILVMLPAALLPAMALPEPHWGSAVVTGALLVTWWVYSTLPLRGPSSADGGGLRSAISGWLAAIGLIDAVYLKLLGEPELAMAAIVCFAMTAFGHRYIHGT
jgi:4-hydroxybenzoate polyprenyltransferase